MPTLVCALCARLVPKTPKNLASASIRSRQVASPFGLTGTGSPPGAHGDPVGLRDPWALGSDSVRDCVHLVLSLRAL